MTPRLPHHLLYRLLLLASCALAVTGCAVADAAAGACTVDADCVTGLKCYEGRFCVAATVAETPVVVRVSPPADSGFVVEQFNLTLTGASQNEMRKLVLTEPAVVHGTVTQKGNLLSASIPGTLLATAPGDVEGRQLSFQATSYSALKRFSGSEVPQGYELRVQKGHNYAVTFWPQSDQIPPHYSTLKAGDSIDQWNLTLPADSELKVLTGRVLGGEGKPVVGLSVWLRDGDGQAWSTRGKTDATGQYSFKVDPTAPPAHLVFGPDPASVDPSVTVLPAGEVAGPVEVTLVTGELPAIQLADIPTMTESVLHVLGPDGQPVAGAAVHFTMKLADLPDEVTLARLGLTWSAVTDASGVVRLLVPPLVGDLQITPPPKSTAARQSWQGVKLAAGDSERQLGHRVKMSGVVHDYSSTPVANALVTWHEIEMEGDGDDGDGDEATFTVQPDALGQFTVWVDPGKYAVWVEPPPGSHLARVLARIDEVTADSSSTPWALVLPPPMVLAGDVLTPAGVPLYGVQVDVLAVKVQTPQGRGGGRTDSRLGRKPSGTVVLDSHLLGSGLTRADGQFEVLLAPGQVAAE